METVPLHAEVRDKKASLRELRSNRLIPAVLYGHSRENVLLQLDYQTFRKALIKAGGSTIIDLDYDDKADKALVYHVQRDPVTDEIIHVDFKFVRMDEAITTKIPLEFIGVSPAVKDLAGLLDHKKTEIEVKCLPADLISSIQVDISCLTDFNAVIHVKDLNVPEKIEVLHDPLETIATVLPPRVEEVETVAPVAAEGEVPVEGEAEEASASEEKKEESPSKGSSKE